MPTSRDTRKELATNYISVNGQTAALGSKIETVNYNQYLLKNLVADTSQSVKNAKIADFLVGFSNETGTLAGENSVSAFMSDMSASLRNLASTPEDGSLKIQAVTDAQRTANELDRLSNKIQGYRLEIDTEIERVVREVNTAIQTVFDINKTIIRNEANKVSTASLEDDRREALEKLASYINIDYFENSNSEIQIYSSGRPLLDSKARTLDYTAANNIDKNVTYPGGFGAIDLNGFDITNNIQGGELGGLISLRDKYFVEEQSKLDNLAGQMITQMNTVSNMGSTYPGRASITGDVIGISGTATPAMSGTFRLATTNSDGVVQNFADIALGGLTNINDLVAAINASAVGPDVTASIASPDNQLRLVANNSGESLIMNQMDSSVGPDGESLAMYFGLNNFFNGTGADDIEISEYLLNDGNLLATGELTPGALSVGDGGIFLGI